MFNAQHRWMRVLKALLNVTHEAATMLFSGTVTLFIFVEKVVGLNFMHCIFMSQFGLLNRCDIHLMPHEDIFKLQDIRYKEVAVPLRNGQLTLCVSGWFCNGLWGG